MLALNTWGNKKKAIKKLPPLGMEVGTFAIQKWYSPI